MIKSISFWSVQGGLSSPSSIAEALAIVRDAGFAGLELCIGLEGALSVHTTRQQCQAIRAAADRAGLVVDTLASGMSWEINPASDDAEVRRRAISLHAAALERAAWLGCRAMLFVPGAAVIPWNANAPIVRYDRAVERAREAVNALLEVAQRVEVDLCIENVWNGLFYSPLELAAFVDSFSSQRLGIYFDVGNALGVHQHPPHWIELLGQRIRRVHIKDFKRSVGGLSGFCDLMAGDVPWPQTMAALRAIGYDKSLVAEMMPWDPALLARTSAAMDQILRL